MDDLISLSFFLVLLSMKASHQARFSSFSSAVIPVQSMEIIEAFSARR
jgi:hypothetical protein